MPRPSERAALDRRRFRTRGHANRNADDDTHRRRHVSAAARPAAQAIRPADETFVPEDLSERAAPARRRVQISERISRALYISTDYYARLSERCDLEGHPQQNVDKWSARPKHAPGAIPSRRRIILRTCRAGRLTEGGRTLVEFQVRR